MNTMKSILMTIAITALMLMTACNGNQQNEHDDHDHDHHEEMEARDGHDHSQMEENYNEKKEEESMHAQHESIRDNFSHQGIIILDDTYQTGVAAKFQLKEVVSAYLEMKNALVNDNIAETDKAAVKMAQKAEAVDGSLFKEEGEGAWQQHALLYSDKLAEMRHVDGLDEKRSYFSHISEIMYCTVKSFDLAEDIELYATYCPMAFDEKGAYWIAETKEISNPYFGSKMLKCGKVKEVL